MSISSIMCHNVKSVKVTEPTILPETDDSYCADIILTYDDGSTMTVSLFSKNGYNLVADAFSLEKEYAKS